MGEIKGKICRHIGVTGILLLLYFSRAPHLFWSHYSKELKGERGRDKLH